MSTKDKANTTKETLEYARCVLEFVEGDQKGPAESVIELIEAAIPLAELEGQAVEFLEVLRSFDMEQWHAFAEETNAEIPKEIQSLDDLEWSGSFTDDGRYTYPARQNLLKCIADALLTQIADLKAKDGTPNVNKAEAE